MNVLYERCMTDFTEWIGFAAGVLTTICYAPQEWHVISTRKLLLAVLRSYVAVADEVTARKLEKYFKSGSGKAFAKKRFLGTSG